MFKLASKEYSLVMTEREQLGPSSELRSQLDKQQTCTPTEGLSGQSHHFLPGLFQPPRNIPQFIFLNYIFYIPKHLKCYQFLEEGIFRVLIFWECLYSPHYWLSIYLSIGGTPGTFLWILPGKSISNFIFVMVGRGKH